MQQANLFAVMQPFILSDVVAHPVNHVLCDNLLNIACQKSAFREDYFVECEVNKSTIWYRWRKKHFLVQSVRLEIETKISSLVEQCASKIRALNKKKHLILRFSKKVFQKVFRKVFQ